MFKFLAKLYQKPLDALDGLLDGLTSYKLVLYYLLVLVAWAIVVSFRKSVPFSWHAIGLSAILLLAVCRASGELFSRVLNIARNFESDYITALILALIMSPATTGKGYAVLVGAGFAAIASKYLLTINRRHVFNPAAFGAVVAGIFFHQYASWWVGTSALVPLVLVGGVLIMRKMKRFLMVIVFFLVYGFFLHQQFDGAAPVHTIWLAATGTGILFFAYVMLLEPQTSPDKFRNYFLYSVLVGIFYGWTRLGISPEESLLIGNVLAYALERGKLLELRLERVQKEAAGLYSFSFSHQGTFDYKPGQFMEWTLPLRHSDSRGNRRYLTLSSSPTENLLSFTVRLPQKASHFKQALAKFKPGDKILASHLGGSFVLPSDKRQKLAFVAGGIGVTPFRSIAKYMIDKKDERDATLLYCANGAAEFAFQDLFSGAKNLGLAAHYIDTSTAPISADIIANAVPDFKQRLFYISGPYGFVKSVRQALLSLGIGPTNIKSDYFPGYG
ncbi:MAG TPA: FAD-dependent oxidoreductase [Candidatus Nitrosopolaris sp.]|nr:FAD-dependent oxidoreductase [Candidatus Nitrosopolaris sp.]